MLVELFCLLRGRLVDLACKEKGKYGIKPVIDASEFLYKVPELVFYIGHCVTHLLKSAFGVFLEFSGFLIYNIVGHFQFGCPFDGLFHNKSTACVHEVYNLRGVLCLTG